MQYIGALSQLAAPPVDLRTFSNYLCWIILLEVSESLGIAYRYSNLLVIVNAEQGNMSFLRIIFFFTENKISSTTLSLAKFHRMDSSFGDSLSNAQLIRWHFVRRHIIFEEIIHHEKTNIDG